MTREAERTSDGLRGPLFAGIVVTAVFFGGIVGWSAQAPLAGAVIADGKLTVEGERKTVQHLEGGIIDEILVTDGASVEAGQPLVRLDTTDAQATRAALMAERDALAARAARLVAERDDADVPDYASLEARGGDSVNEAIANQEVLFAARQKERAAALDMLEGSRMRLASRVDAIRAEADSVDEQLALLEETAQASRQLAKRGVLARSELRQIERDVAEVSGRRDTLRARLAEALAAIDEVDLRLAEFETQRLSVISEELAKVHARQAEIEPTLRAAEEKIRRSVLRAPVAGEVVGLSVSTIGGILGPGERVMDIVPERADLIALARVAPRDRERLSDGAGAEIRLLGVSRQRDATIDGRVVAISADRLQNDEGDEDSHYEIQVVLENPPADLRLKPGMPVTAVVATAPRTVLEYLLAPLSEAIARSMREE